jgi:serine/threonine protein kinase
MIIMPYYVSGDLVHFIKNYFYKINWKEKMFYLKLIINGLINMHSSDIIHRDFHSGNIFFRNTVPITPIIGDLGISKSATESANNCDEIYGIIPYMAPEILQGQQYTKASDIYGFGMIMWEFMTGRRPFWDRDHDTVLIIKICDGLRPPIVTNAPEGYVELMKECWLSDPKKRPIATVIFEKIDKIYEKEENYNNRTKIIRSSETGPMTKNNPGAIYKSRTISSMTQSTMSLASSRSLTINLETGK